VAQRGGMLGFGSRRVMALGYPLLSVLSVSELRAVIAHEFAHYYGGDTGFGPWTNKTRETIIFSPQRLSADSGFFHWLSRWAYLALLQWIVVGTLVLYWNLFLRLTLLVSHQWEYRADELASAVAGAKPLLEGLRKLTEAGVAWVPYWATEAAPARIGIPSAARRRIHAIPRSAGHPDPASAKNPQRTGAGNPGRARHSPDFRAAIRSCLGPQLPRRA